MLSALLNLVGSMGAISVLAGVVSGIIFLVDTMLHWSSRTSLEPWAVSNTHHTALPSSAANGTVVHHESNGIGNGKLHHDVTDWIIPTSPIRVPLQTLDAPLKSLRTPRSLVGDGDSGSVMGVADDVLLPRAASEAAGVRQLMEQLVESLVSGGLDDVVLRPKDPHPQYGRIFKRHQPRLRSALTSLAYSLQMAMAQKPLSECEMPGRAHAQLRAIILDLARDVAALDRHPDPAEHNGDVATGLDGVLDVKEDFATRAYEDILATAIVNKVMERSTTRNSIKRNNNNNNSFVSSLEVRLGSVEDSPESGTSSFNGSWTGSSQLDHSLDDVDSDPLSLMIEECIEEVTTITATSSSSASSSSLDERSEGEDAPVPRVVRRRRRRSARRRGSSSGSSLPLPPSGPPSLIAGLSFLKQRVPFPELGVDIVDVDWSSGESELSDTAEAQRPVNGLGGEHAADGWRTAPPDGAEREAADVVDGGVDGRGEDRPASCLELVTPLQSWEDNWLFQSKRIRKPAAQYAHHPVPVPMLVPNPSEDFRALIGDVDAEETSDLSECSDDALEEVVLAGMRPKAESDQFSEDLSLSEAAGRPLLDGLAETCNLELLRRAAPALSTAPAPRAARTDRTANLDGAASSPDRLSPVSTPSTPTSRASRGRHSPNDLVGRWARDQDAEMTILYDTPTRREAPAKDVPANKHAAAAREAAAQPLDTTQHRPVAEVRVRPAPAEHAVPEVNKDDAEEALRSEPKTAAPTPADKPDGAEELQQLEELHVEAVPPESLDDENLFTPPRPGTIAEREHRKWLEATPLANNPYSPENIQRRLQQRASLSGQQPLLPPAPAAVSPATGGPGNLPPSADTSLHIALRVDPDPKKYGRDFYINTRQSDQPTSGLRRAHSTTVADRRNGHLETPIVPWSSAVRTNGDGGSEDSSPVPTPSVRELAKQFLTQPAEQPAAQPPRTKPTDTAKVVIVGKDTEVGGGAEVANKKAVRQVHSLTARSMSREFREGLRHLAVGRPAAAPGVAGAQPSAPATDQPSDRPDPEGARQPAEAE